jgi:hypothetical protein
MLPFNLNVNRPLQTEGREAVEEHIRQERNLLLFLTRGWLKDPLEYLKAGAEVSHEL